MNFKNSRGGSHQRLDEDLLYIAPTRFTLSVLRFGLVGFPSVCETCTVPKFWISPTLAPAICRSYPPCGHPGLIPFDNAHEARG